MDPVTKWIVPRLRAAQNRGESFTFQPADIARDTKVSVEAVYKTLESYQLKTFTTGHPIYRIQHGNIPGVLAQITGEAPPVPPRDDETISVTETRQQPAISVTETEQLLKEKERYRQELDELKKKWQLHAIEMQKQQAQAQQQQEQAQKNQAEIERLTRELYACQNKEQVCNVAPKVANIPVPPPLPPAIPVAPVKLPPPTRRLSEDTPTESKESVLSEGLKKFRKAQNPEIDDKTSAVEEDEWDDKPKVKCQLCGESAQFMCGKCQLTPYCSAECQQLDYPFHQQIECPLPK